METSPVAYTGLVFHFSALRNLRNNLYRNLLRQALGPFGSEAALRACFDPNSEEWDSTDMAAKAQTLRKCIAAGLDLPLLLRHYEITRRQQGKNFSEAATQLALAQIITHLLTDHQSGN